MSQENLELHRRAFDSFNRRDLDAFLALADRNIELTPLNLELEGGCYRGHGGVRSFWKDYLTVFPDFSVELDEVRDLGDVTVARIRLRGRHRQRRTLRAADLAGRRVAAQEVRVVAQLPERGRCARSCRAAGVGASFEVAGGDAPP